jgi:drug/metabolite transporter (DMT)-like permease
MDLLLSIFSSTLIFILFRSFPKYKVDTLQAVVANYFVAFTCGIMLFSNDLSTLKNQEIMQASPFAFLCGVLFISLFVIMGISSQKNGVATTSIAVKMSMALSVLFVLIAQFNAINFNNLIPLILALAGVFLVSYQGQTKEGSGSAWMLGILFLGSAGLDLVLFFVQDSWLPNFHKGLFASLGFGMAGCLGLLYLIYLSFQKKLKFNLRSWVGGIVLGIPNYFSIYLLVKAYKSLGIEPQQVLSIANVGVVLASALVGFLLFKEPFSWKKGWGMVLCLLALSLSVISFEKIFS